MNETSRITSPDREITDLDGVGAYFELDPGSSLERIQQAVYEQTECGATLAEEGPSEMADGAPGVSFWSAVEGSEARTAIHTLRYPFNQSDIDSALSQIEEEASELWHEANCHAEGCPHPDECGGCSPSCRCYGFSSAPDDTPGFDPMFMFY